jgi:hypothetical protein
MVAAGMPSETWGMARTRRFLASEAMAWAHAREGRTNVDAHDNHPAGRLTTTRPEHERTEPHA